ncbi:MAG TPA: anhydro-N-acetylmuramic acid kinase, partial [Candidatus Deferrimicrobium sp.]|nr:anhydro-N-acetylmuramic acid kinase [Candidatus Deferrimicrobium sp.]
MRILGLNSGTSADGLDMALVEVKRTNRGVTARYLAGRAKRYPDNLRDLVLRVADSRTIDLNTVIHLDQLLGQFFGRAADDYLKRLTASKFPVDVVASHGQTVRHLPTPVRLGRFVVSGTLQLGSPEQIAVATGKTVVADFRQADVAIGNEGAPITTPAMLRLFARSDRSVLIVNIGGIANYFYFPRSQSRLKPSAEDCGPGNGLSDILSQQLFNERFDRNGARAAAGKVSQRLVSLLVGHPFFIGKTASTGREVFGVEMAHEMRRFGRQFNLAPEDLLATAQELTASSIVRKIRPLVRRDKTLSCLYVTGGGRKNACLTGRLRHH